MQILHVLDHSLPKISGYAIRSHAILKNLQANGIKVFALTSDRQGLSDQACERIEGVTYFRTQGLSLVSVQAQPRASSLLPSQKPLCGWAASSVTQRSSGLLAQLSIPLECLLSFFQKNAILKQCATFFSTLLSVHRAILQLKPQVIHVHSPCTLGLAAWLAAKRHRIPVIYEIRAFWEDAFNANHQQHASLRTLLVRHLETFLCHRVAKIVVICAGLAKALEKRSIPFQKILIVPNGVTVPPQASVDQQRQAVLKTDFAPAHHKIIGFIGSFYAYEGILLLCQAFLKCSHQHNTLHLLLVGSGPEFLSIKQFLASSPLRNQVSLIASVPPDAIQAYYQICDILVYPRLASPLTDTVTPLKPLEAIIQKKPILFSNVGGLLDLIPDPLPASIFQADSLDHLSQAIEAWLENPEVYQQWAEKTYQTLIATRQWSGSVKRYLPEYAALVKKKPANLPHSKPDQVKVVFIGPPGPPWGGMAIQTQAFLRQCEKHSQPCDYVPLVLPMAVGRKPGRLLEKLGRLLQFYGRAFQAICSAGIVHLIINSGKTWMLHAPFVCVVTKCLGKQLLINYRGGDAAHFIAKHPRWILPFLKRADWLVVQSVYLQNVFLQQGLRSQVIPNPIDTQFFGLARSLALKNRYQLLLPRHLESVYGIITALEAMAILKQQHGTRFYLSILGGGTQRQLLQSLIAQLALTDCVCLVGEVEHQNMLFYYEQSDLVLNTSLQDNFPNALLEANASGVPVITTAVGGIAQLYTHQKTAWLIEPNEAPQLAKAIQTLLESPVLYQALSANALKLVQGWTWDHLFPVWQALYQQDKQEVPCNL